MCSEEARSELVSWENTSLTTYNLSDGIDWWLALFIVCLEPEHKCLERLRAKRLYHEDQREKQRFPACQEADDGFHAPGSAFGFTTNLCHSFSRNLQVLIDAVSTVLSEVSREGACSLAQ